MEESTNTKQKMSHSNHPYVAFTYQEVMQAYEDCVENKKNTSNAMKYSEFPLQNVYDLCNEINSHTYEIGRSIAFIVKFPVYREVFAADFRDRVVHHLIMRELLPLFEADFIEDTYSCRKEKGVIFGIHAVEEHIRACTNDFTTDAWVAKMDIKSFFMSIDKQLLADMVDAFIVERYHNKRKKECLRWLCRKIIMHRPELLCDPRGDLNAWKYLEKGKSLFEKDGKTGIPIGNLTSQIFANFYLTPLDKFITETLGFVHYGRYVDDFVIISEDKQKLLDAIPLICEFASTNLLVKIHPNKRYIQHYTKGTPFIGSIIKKGYTYIINRTKGTLYYKIKFYFRHFSEERLDEFINVVNSYLGFMLHHSTYNIRKAILTDRELLGEWYDHIRIAPDYSKITRKVRIKHKYKHFTKLENEMGVTL